MLPFLWLGPLQPKQQRHEGCPARELAAWLSKALSTHDNHHSSPQHRNDNDRNDDENDKEDSSVRGGRREEGRLDLSTTDGMPAGERDQSHRTQMESTGDTQREAVGACSEERQLVDAERNACEGRSSSEIGDGSCLQSVLDSDVREGPGVSQGGHSNASGHPTQQPPALFCLSEEDSVAARGAAMEVRGRTGRRKSNEILTDWSREALWHWQGLVHRIQQCDSPPPSRPSCHPSLLAVCWWLLTWPRGVWTSQRSLFSSIWLCLSLQRSICTGGTRPAPPLLHSTLWYHIQACWSPTLPLIASHMSVFHAWLLQGMESRPSPFAVHPPHFPSVLFLPVCSGRCARDPFHRLRGSVVTLISRKEDFALRRVGNELGVEVAEMP